jgi:hypothetical protein
MIIDPVSSTAFLAALISKYLTSLTLGFSPHMISLISPYREKAWAMSRSLTFASPFSDRHVMVAHAGIGSFRELSDME